MVFRPERNNAQLTNAYGFYSIALPEGDTRKLTLSSVGFAPVTRRLPSLAFSK